MSFPGEEAEITIEGELCEARAASGCDASLDEREMTELVDEYEDERECLLKDCESEESVFSRPRVAMSSTKDGRVVMAGDRSRGAILVKR